MPEDTNTLIWTDSPSPLVFTNHNTIQETTKFRKANSEKIEEKIEEKKEHWCTEVWLVFMTVLLTAVLIHFAFRADGWLEKISKKDEAKITDPRLSKIDPTSIIKDIGITTISLTPEVITEV
jgi:hypothetical protein